MESGGAVGKVNINRATYDLIESDPDFIFESQGRAEVKGKVVMEMEMYFVGLNQGLSSVEF